MLQNRSSKGYKKQETGNQQICISKKDKQGLFESINLGHKHYIRKQLS